MRSYTTTSLYDTSSYHCCNLHRLIFFLHIFFTAYVNWQSQAEVLVAMASVVVCSQTNTQSDCGATVTHVAFLKGAASWDELFEMPNGEVQVQFLAVTVYKCKVTKVHLASNQMGT